MASSRRCKASAASRRSFQSRANFSRSISARSARAFSFWTISAIAETARPRRSTKYLVAFKCRHCFPETKVDREIRWPPRYLWNLIKHGKFIPKKQDAPVGDEGD